MNNKVKCLLCIFLCLFIVNVKAQTNKTYIDLEKMEYSYDNNTYSKIKEYNSLEEFFKDYNSNNLQDIYITNFLFDGVREVITPDLDDYKDEDSNDLKVKKLSVNVLNIINTGDYELTGKTIGTMIGINTNNLKGNINLYLNNIDIDTDTKKAPAIYVYNKSTTYTDCNVTIKTLKNTKNYISGGKLKKVSLLDKNNLNNYTNYYTNQNLEDYNKFTSYYGIYTSEEIENILFATVKADNEDLREGDPYYFYKASGAISSDIDLYFDGEGYLKVSSKNKEGIESKGNLSLIGGTGDYEVHAFDDCLNTTTASSAGNNIRNDLIINVNSLITIVNDEGDEGDAIDSNGTLTINGGKIYAFSHSKSQDSGLDSGNGIIINGGTIISTGNMSDRILNESKQEYIYLNFNETIISNSLIVIKDEKDNIITAFKTNKDLKTLFYSDNNIKYKSLKVYINGEIDGKETNGLYTKINNYKNGEEIEFNNMNFNQKNENNLQFILKISLLIEFILLIITCIFGRKIIKDL